MAEYSIAILRFIFLALGPVTYVLGKNHNVLNCQGSPVDFVPDLVKGRATISLPISLLDLQLSVEMKYVERDGIAVLLLSPVLRDERKCVDYPTGNRKLCYEYSEVHWGRTNEEGSDHSVGGYNYPMEVQHYFHRTNSTHSLIPVAVGVLFQEMSNDSLPHRPSDTSEGAFSEIHEKYPSFMEEKKRLTLGLARLLPSQMEEKPFYHYRGPVTGQCGPEMDWIVFEDPLEVVPSFLSFLGLLNGKDSLNHHFPPVSRNACYLYSHYSEETDRDDCGFNEAVARTVTSGNKSGNSPDSFQGKSGNVRESVTTVNTSDYAPIPTASSDLATVETDKAGVLSSKFGGYATSQFDSVSTHSFDSRTVIENVGIIPKETTPLLPQSAEFGGGITSEETPHPTLPIASSTESAQPPRNVPSNETFHTTSSLLTSTRLTQELLEPTSVEQPLHSSDIGELGSLSTFTYSVTLEHTSSTVEDDQAETSPQEGIEPELITAPEHYVRERPDGSGASTGRLTSELPLFVFLISRILFW